MINKNSTSNRAKFIIPEVGASSSFIAPPVQELVNHFEKVDQTIAVFPNPVVSQLNITGLESGTTIQIYNSIGQLEIQTVDQVIDVSNLNTGIHYIISEGKIKTKFIKE